MNNLLDTHTLIWFINGDNDLSNSAKLTIEGNPLGNYVSIISVWEIAIKISLGKLNLKTSFEDFINKIKLNAFKILSVKEVDAFSLSLLPFHRKDPFDRMMIVQAANNNLQIITRDSHFSDYNVSISW